MISGVSQVKCVPAGIYDALFEMSGENGLGGSPNFSVLQEVRFYGRRSFGIGTEIPSNKNTDESTEGKCLLFTQNLSLLK